MSPVPVFSSTPSPDLVARLTDSAPRLRIICSWCDLVLCEGAPGAFTSHGMCVSCSETLLKETA
jgi:hypothetical protein